MKKKNKDTIQPVSGTIVPRFAGPSTFARLPELRDVESCDVAIVGIPFDAGTSYRPGARFGPQSIRQASRHLRTNYHPDYDVEPFKVQQVADAGDITCNPFNIKEAIHQIENGLAQQYNEKWVDGTEITQQNIQHIIHPSMSECEKFGLDPIYLSYFVPWSSHHNYEVAKLWGFRHLGHEHTREGSIDNYDQIDSLSYMLNPYLKYVKYGHSVATDNASRWIRYGLKTREEMIPIVEEVDKRLDQVIVDRFCEFTGITRREFFKILGVSLTFPGLYTPWTLPNAAAIINLSLTVISSEYA